MPAAQDSTRAAWLTHAALLLALVLVMARGMILQYVRDIEPLVPLGPGEAAPARDAGAAVGVVLDALCFLPALLVLARAAVDETFRLKRLWSVLPLGVLAIWAFFSFAWASDSFAAAASASTWLAAAALVFALGQTVRTWGQFRLCAAAAAGLLLVNVAQGVLWHTMDLPALRADFERNREAILAARGIEPGSFRAQQFEQRVMAGQFGGFGVSPNSYAGMLAMLGLLTVGLAWQRWRDRKVGGETWFPWALAAGAAPAFWLMGTTGSRAAMGGLAIGVVVLGACWWLREVLSRHRRASFAGGVLLVLLGAAAVVGTGLATDGLLQRSLTFRWHYWIGATGVIAESPLIGVGFANFGDAYLAHRLAIAPEEVNDPHNLLVRFAAETGVVGLLLALGWLALLGWELTRPAPAGGGVGGRRPAEAAPGAGARTANGVTDGFLPGPRLLMVLAGAATLVSVLAAVDFGADPDWAILAVARRVVLGLALAMGLMLGLLRSSREPIGERSPAPVLAAVISVAVGVALLHSMIDVVIFEPAVLMSFVLIAGATIGIRSPVSEGSRRRGAAMAIVVLAAGFVTWLALYVGPTVIAERTAAEGDRLVMRGLPRQAMASYREAAGWSPVPNADYWARAVHAGGLAGLAGDRVGELATRAVEVDPRGVRYLMLRASVYERAFDPPRLEEAASDVAAAVRLDPRQVSYRLRLADLLERLGRRQEAADQLREALRLNSLLEPGEPKRLPESQVERLEARLEEMKSF